MSETLSQDPESLGSGYSLSTGGVATYPSQPATPSSTVQEVPSSSLPPFATFSSDIDTSTGFPTDRLFTDTRLLDISNWDYYGEGLTGRLLERTENGLSIITSQPQYRPWESKPLDSTQTFALTTPVTTFADAFTAQNGVPKLPSFQSQFQSYNDPNGTTTSEPSLTTLTNLTPVSPNSSSSPQSQNLTTLNNSSFHTLSAVNPRNYPLVPAPVQAREIPSIQQQFLDERHIQMYAHATPNLTTLNAHPTNIFPSHNGAIIQNNQLIQGPTVVTVLKPEPSNLVDLKLGSNLTPLQDGLKIQNVSVGLHPTQFQNPMSTMLDNGYSSGLEKKVNGFNVAMGSPTRNDFRKKERRKIRASSLESSATESDGASSNMEIGSENSGQVAAISSTAGFKSPHQTVPTNGGMEIDEISGGNGDKQVKKKRKRCGECIGCQRKDNCGDCAPCRNDKSHQICKQRRCEKLTEKKNLYGDGSFARGESRRGRGKGRGTGSYRGRKPTGGVSIAAASSTVAAPEPSPQPTSRPSPQPQLTMLKPDQPTVQQPMAPMPFYADPNRFPAPVWQADPTQGWPQGQFIQQIPHTPQTPLEGYPQQYPNAIYQTTYQQPGFESNTFYASPVQVLTNQRPPSQPGHATLTPRANGTYSHTPSPSPINQNQQNGHRSNISGQYGAPEYPPAAQPFNAPATTPTSGNMETSSNGGISRPNSVGSNVNAPGNQSQNFPTPTSNSFTTNSSTNFSPGTTAAPNYVGSNMQNQTNSGNAKPGYPQVSSSPQQASHNSSGYPGGQFSGQSIQSNQNPPQMTPNDPHQNWTPERDRGNWEQNTNNDIQHQGFMQHSNQITNMQQNMGQQNQINNIKNHMNQNMQMNPPQAQNNTHMQQPIPSPHHQQTNQMHNQVHMQSQQNNINQSPNQHSHQIHNQNPNTGDTQFSQSDRVNLNSRIKTMILNKQQTIDNKMEDVQKVDENNSTGHFLSYSHHRRLNYFSDGGGLYDYNHPSNGSALENFMKFASNENYTQPKWNNPSINNNNNIVNNQASYKQFSYQENSSLDKNTTNNKVDANFYSYNNDNPSSNQHQINNHPLNTQVPFSCHQSIENCQNVPLTPIKSEIISNNNISIQTSQNVPTENNFTKPVEESFITKPNEFQTKTEATNTFIKPEIPYQNYEKTPEIVCKVESSDNSEKINVQPSPTPAVIETVVNKNIKLEVKDIKLEKEAYIFEGTGGPATLNSHVGSWCCRRGGTDPPTSEHLKDGVCMGLQTQDEILEEKNPEKKNTNQTDAKSSSDKSNPVKEYTENIEKLKNNIKTEIPDCNCFPADKSPPEPGSYYTHLGCANSLPELRKELETRIGISGKALRIEKVCYTGKEGKTTQGCPLAKWIIRRSNYEEKILAIVKHRQGHTCPSAYIIVCIVAWEGIPSSEADQTYNLLTHKLNRYGLPTTRRCATNEPRTCACQGLDPDTCGASFSFGCSWSMYYNGCKYARSKTVRKFRLSVKAEENEIEEKMHVLSTLLSPLYNSIAPDAFKNQCQFEREASECRLGFKTGRPFSGVTACLDFCSHSHRDLHNMNNGCTVVVTLTKHRSLSKPTDEQLHVLPLYVIDETDEFGSKETQEEKFKNGTIEKLTKYPCEVRVRSVPLQPCRRHGKKRKEDEPDAIIGKKEPPNSPRANNAHSPRSGHGSPRAQTPGAHQTPLIDMVSMLDNFTDAQLQSSQVSSTVLDSPTMYPSWNYESNILNNQNQFVNQYPNQNQLYQPNPNWIEAQKRPGMYFNSWPENSGYKDGVKEDPDSTTAISTPNLVDDKLGQVDSTLPNSSDKNREPINNTYLNSVDKLNPNFMANNPQQMKNTQNTYDASLINQKRNNQPWCGSNKFGENFNTANNQQQVQYGQQMSAIPVSPDSRIHSSNMIYPQENKISWPPNHDRTNWDQTKTQPPVQNDTSPFRIPQGRPPSRTHNTAMSPDTNTHPTTFLKPYPPEKKPPPNIDIKPNINNNGNFVNNHLKQMENLHASLNNWTEDVKPNINEFHSAVNPGYLNQTYPNPVGYSNMPTPFNSYNPYNPYEANPLNYDYNSIYNAEKLKRDEYLRNSACYNNYGYQNYPNWCQNNQNWCQNTPNWCIYPPPFGIPYVPEQPKSEPIGVVTDYIDNAECFKDSQMGGVAIALGHGSVLFECAKHEMHATTALRKPNRLSPTRISLVFYQHRNLNKPKHGLEEWEEKMRLRKLGITTTNGNTSTTISNIQAQSGINSEDKEKDKEKEVDLAALVKASNVKNGKQIMMRAPTLTTVSWTTLFPMHPCMVTGPYQDGGAVG